VKTVKPAQAFFKNFWKRRLQGKEFAKTAFRRWRIFWKKRLKEKS